MVAASTRSASRKGRALAWLPCLFALVLATVPLNAVSADGTQSSASLPLVTQTGGSTRAIALDGAGHAIVGVGPRLVVLDVATAGSPRQMGQSDPAFGLIRGLAVADGYAYVIMSSASAPNVLRVFDLSNLTHPVDVGGYSVPSGDPSGGLASIFGVAVEGSFAYVAAGTAGLHVLDVSDRTHPTEVGTQIATAEADTGVVVAHNDLVYVSGNSTFFREPGQVRIVDVSDPTSPIAVGEYRPTTESLPPEVTILDHYALVATAGNGWSAAWGDLRIVDVADPIHPVEVADAGVGPVAHVAVVGTTAFVSTAIGAHGPVTAVDLTDPLHPRVVGSFDTSTPDQVAAGDGRAYVVGHDGLQIAGSSPASQFLVLGQYLPSVSWYIAGVSGSTAIATLNGHLRTINVQDPSNPITLSDISLPSGGTAYIADATVDGRYAYVTTGLSGLRVVDLGDPRQPREIGSYVENSLGCPPNVQTTACPEFMNQVRVVGNRAYALFGSGMTEHRGVLIIDVSDPRHPHRLGTFDTRLIPNGLSVSGTRAYMTDGQTLYVLDVSNPASPNLLVTEELDDGVLGHVAQVASGTQYVYTATPDGLHVIDFSNPNSPVVVTRLVGDWRDVTVSGGYLLGGQWRAGWRVAELSNPAQPQEIGLVPSLGGDVFLSSLSAGRIVVAGDLIYASNDSSGLWVFGL